MCKFVASMAWGGARSVARLGLWLGVVREVMDLQFGRLSCRAASSLKERLEHCSLKI